MENHKRNHSVLVVSFLIVFTAGIFVFLFRDKIADRRQEISQPDAVAGPYDKLPQETCGFKSDADAYVQATKDMSLETCGCLKDVEQKKNCELTVSDPLYFKQALSLVDPELCRKISNSEVVKNCEAVVANKVKAMLDQNIEQLIYVYNSTGRAGEAAALLEKAMAKDSQNIDLKISLALSLANQALSQHREQELIPKALVAIEEAIELGPASTEAYRVKGYIHEVQPDLVAAVQSYDKAIELDPKFILAYVGRAHANNMAMQLGLALADLQKAKSLDPDRRISDIYAQLCRLESDGPMVDSAIEDCLLYARSATSGSQGEAQAMLAALYLKAGRASEAESRIKLALIYRADDPNTYIIGARVAAAQGDLALAKARAEKAIGLDGSRALAHAQLSDVLLEQGDAKGAIVSGEKALSLVDGDVSVLKTVKSATKYQIYATLADAYTKNADPANEKKYRELMANEK